MGVNRISTHTTIRKELEFAVNTRGQYRNGQGRTYVGASFLHTLELRQRYDNAKTAAVQALLNDLSSDGVASSVGTNRWQIALKDGAWVTLAWYPDHAALEITITDRELRPVDQVASVRLRYEAILRKITPRLQSFGVTTVGGAIYAPQERPTIAGGFDERARGQYGASPRELVGITIYHSVGDRADAVKQMDIDWNALYQNLASQAGELVRDPTSPSGYRIMTQREWDANPPDPKKVAWWKSHANPLIKQWVKFKHDQIGGDRTHADDYISFAERFQTNWDVYENWKKKLDTLRSEAEKRGFTVDATKPTDLPTTVWADVAHTVERGAGAVGTGLGDVWKLAKYGLWAVLGIGAVVALSSVASNLRSGKDPAEKYVELIKRRSRTAARTALPARAPLALPPGEPVEGA